MRLSIGKRAFFRLTHSGIRLKSGLGWAALCALLALGGCRSEPEWQWERAEAGLPRRAVILALAGDPDDARRIWAGYYAPAGLATSHDGGQTWTSAAQGLGDNPVFDLLALPAHSLWAATRDGLLVSGDGGASWKTAGGNLPALATFALAADDSGRVYAGLDGAGLYQKEAEGERWAALAGDERLARAAVLSLAVSPEGRQLYAGTAGQGVFASDDAGHTWTAAFPANYVPNLALYPMIPQVAVASLRDRLVRTQDGGRSWHELPVAWAAHEVVALLWRATSDDQPGGMLLASTGQGQVYCSQDAGESWLALGPGLPTEGGVLDLEVSGGNSPGGPQRLLAGTWTGIYAGLMPKDCREGIHGWTYLSPGLGSPYAHALLATEAGLLIGTRAGLFRWQPTSGAWAPAPSAPDFPPGGVTALAMAPSARQVVYAGSASKGLYRSADGGISWIKVPSDFEFGIRALAVAPEKADRIYALAAWERMYESDDGGQSWQARWTGLGLTREAISLAIDAGAPATIYLGADSGLYRSRYAGEDWQPVGRPLDEQTVLTLATRPAAISAGEPGVLYIGATRGAYRSSDAGDTVEPWGQGLEDVSVTAFLFDPSDAGTVYAGSAYAGLFQSLDGGETWHSLGPSALADDVVEGLAWGPAGELFVAAADSVWLGRH